ncbi:ribonuclease T2 family protein [Nitrosomonas sp. ANs5]|uniref:ribonuclease T2 family protein n=1 Tax=Nitrosomonas sp. ANs5 TaxID=3423941 RepID=UPI003D355EAA
MRRCRNVIFIIGWLSACLIVAGPAWAARFAGEIKATQACPAYFSKNKQTNPGDIRLEPGKAYAVFEANRIQNPLWYRIRVPAAQPAERWVEAACGVVRENPPHQSAVSKCNVAGKVDSFVLALTWQPAFCTINSHKKECQTMGSDNRRVAGFTLHGLWPNNSACGINYGFCGQISAPAKNFCSYPAISLNHLIRESLNEVMPSAKGQSCLQRHQWHKHGVCQTTWSADEYFELSIGLTHWFNQTGMARLMRSVHGQVVRTDAFLDEVAVILGNVARRKVVLICQQNKLLEMRLNFAADLAVEKDPGKLVARAPDAKKNTSCGEAFRVVDITHQ